MAMPQKSIENLQSNFSAPSSSAASDGQHHNDIISLLRCCWPSGNLCHQLAIRNPITRKFNTILVRSPEHAMVVAIREASAGQDAYFAVAEYKSDVNRKAENVANISLFLMDIDIGEDKAESGTGYRTIEGALAELYIFCEAVGIPRPTHIVHSGSGLHVYWVLTTPIGPELWKVLAQKLKSIAKQSNFLADPSRTADIASLLRIPGTPNCKYFPPKPVVLLHASDELIPLHVIADAISATHDCLFPAAPKPTSNGDCHCEDASSALLTVILKRIDPDVTYCDWFLVGAVIFNETGGSEDGYELFDKWSSDGDKYGGPADTHRIWRSYSLDHPAKARIGTLIWMLQNAGHDWQHIIFEAELEGEASV
jgi:hypothetical protein